jgi:hypothetical protein
VRHPEYPSVTLLLKRLSELPFDDRGELEIIEGQPEGANISFMPDAPQEFASGLDTDLRKMAQQLQGVRSK